MSVIVLINKIIFLLSKRRKYFLFIFLFFSCLSGFAEIFSIGIVIPFMDLMLNVERIYFYIEKFKIKIDLTNFNKNQILFFITILFITAVFISSIIKIFIGYLTIKITTGINHEVNTMLYNKVTGVNYISEAKLNESELITNISKVQDFTTYLINFLSILSNTVILLFILLTVFFFSDIYILYGAIVFIFFYLIISIRVKNRILYNSKQISKFLELRTSHLQNTIGLLKDIIVNNLKNNFSNKFKSIDYSIVKASIFNTLIQVIPGFLTVSLAIILFSLIILALSISDRNLVSQIPILAAIVFGAQKVIPLLQQIYSSFGKIKSMHYQTLSVTNVFLNKNSDYKLYYPYKDLEIKEICLDNINYKYAGNKNFALKNFNFNAKINDKILIKGSSGAGKTTLINILLGLLKPNSGRIKINKMTVSFNDYAKILKNSMSFVPQKIYLTQDTYAKNVTLDFDTEKINKQLIESCKIAEIHKHIISKKNKYKNLISHDGRSISGGQIQRLGMARAIYRNKKILIFDETTNAIDFKTEKKIFNNLKKYLKNRIFILITHKKINKKFFNKIYYL
jgi:ABC-type bacteriocin/lantibiotic exporter with double-glycine peptidase domain